MSAAIRTGESIRSLSIVLPSMIALSPARSSTASRKAIDQIAKDLRRHVVVARADPDIESFARRCFNGIETEGSA
jgi:hypothetical protein